VLHLPHEPGEVSQWQCHDYSTVNIATGTIIIIIVAGSVTANVLQILSVKKFKNRSVFDKNMVKSLQTQVSGGMFDDSFIVDFPQSIGKIFFPKTG